VWVAGLAIGCLAVVLLAINNLRDVVADRASAKRTLAVRFGERFAIAEIAVCSTVPFLCVVAIAGMRSNWLLLIVLIAFPLAIALIVRVRMSQGAELNRCLAMAGALQWAFGILFVIGCLV
jgi:1,4-dihydroxy-2-naphthoate octaprenyltransferase